MGSPYLRIALRHHEHETKGMKQNLTENSMTGNDTNSVWSALKVKVPLEAQEGGASGEKRRGSLGKWAWLSVCKSKYFSLLVEPVRLLHRRHRDSAWRVGRTKNSGENTNIYQQETRKNAGRSNSLDVDQDWTWWRRHAVCLCLFTWQVHRCVRVWMRRVWGPLMGRSILDMGGCQSYSSSDEEDVSALKENYTNVSLFKVWVYTAPTHTR